MGHEDFKRVFVLEHFVHAAIISWEGSTIRHLGSLRTGFEHSR